MKRYRIKETHPGRFVIEERCLWFFWVDVSTTRFPFPPTGYSPIKPLRSVEDCRERIKKWQEAEAFVPVIHAP